MQREASASCDSINALGVVQVEAARMAERVGRRNSVLALHTDFDSFVGISEMKIALLIGVYFGGIITIMTVCLKTGNWINDDEFGTGIVCFFWPVVLLITLAVFAGAVPFYFIPRGITKIPGWLREWRKKKRLALKSPTEAGLYDSTPIESYKPESWRS